MLTTLPARHVHLDFHTSPHIPGVGSRFSAKQFAQALKLGQLNHITVFAKCHHGLSYYPTSAGCVHPTLKLSDGSTDLLGKQLEVCRRLKVRAPIYMTVGWAEHDAATHSQWCARNKEGQTITWGADPKAKPDDPRPACAWTFLCTNTGYRLMILDQTREVCERYPIVDGFFYDICMLDRCYCDKCKADMHAAGVDINNDTAVVDWYTQQWASFMRDCRAVIAEKHPQASAYFNGRAEMTTPQVILEQQTHYELEDLPTTWGGYDKLPPRAKFFATFDKVHGRPFKPALAMSGKFHTSWGEFGGFKHPDAIAYEAAAMISFGVSCSFGDQMPPNGEMDLMTYRNIGFAYHYVKSIEKYGLPSEPASNLGVWLSQTGNHDQGVCNMLMEAHLDFEIAHPVMDLSKFSTIILTGGQCLDQAQADKLTRYVEAGGSLLVLGESALNASKDRFMLDVGADYVGRSGMDVDYVVAGRELAKNLTAGDAPFLCYSPALLTLPVGKSKVLAAIREPHFKRTYAHFCSHLNTPYVDKNANHPGVVHKGRVIFMAHALGSMYHTHGARVHRELFINALRRLYKQPMVEVNLPSAARVSLLHQPHENRYVVHLLYATPLQRGRCLIIEDLPQLRDLKLTLNLPEKIKRMSLPLLKRNLPITRHNSRSLSVTVPQMKMHEIVLAEY